MTSKGPGWPHQAHLKITIMEFITTTQGHQRTWDVRNREWDNHKLTGSNIKTPPL